MAQIFPGHPRPSLDEFCLPPVMFWKTSCLTDPWTQDPKTPVPQLSTKDQKLHEVMVAKRETTNNPCYLPSQYVPAPNGFGFAPLDSYLDDPAFPLVSNRSLMKADTLPSNVSVQM